MHGPSLRVLVVDDNESVRRTICKLLRSEADIEVTCEAIDGVDALSKAREHVPDLVLLDVTMPTMNGLEAARILKREFPAMQIVIVTQHESRGFQWAALAAGVNGYVVKSDAARDLVPEVRRVVAGAGRGSRTPKVPSTGGF
jgi:DNA-binding NarL/FixJ family response regulator